MADKLGFFDVDERYAALSAVGDPLERLATVVDFEIFRPVGCGAGARIAAAADARPMVLAAKGFLAMGGQITDATLIAAPRQQLTTEEKATIRNGGAPEG